MRSLLFLAFLHLVFSSSDNPTIRILDRNQPIYIGQSFYPPTMSFMAWQSTPEKPLKDWCIDSADCTDHRIFSLGGIEGLQIHDYFEKAAYLTRLGNRFADCVITPESVKMGVCGLNEGAKRFPGPGVRKWTCWVSEETGTDGDTKSGEIQLEDDEEVDTSTVTVYETVYTGSPSSAPTGTLTS